MRRPPTSPVIMVRVREAYLASTLSYAEIGLRMGYSDRDVARAKAFQFVNHIRQPSAAKLARFAHAVRVPISQLLAAVSSPQPVAS